MAITWQVMAGGSWSTVRLCDVLGTGEVKNKYTPGGKKGAVTFQIA